jgi:hypothetical protein
VILRESSWKPLLLCKVCGDGVNEDSRGAQGGVLLSLGSLSLSASPLHPGSHSISPTD